MSSLSNDSAAIILIAPSVLFNSYFIPMRLVYRVPDQSRWSTRDTLMVIWSIAFVIILGIGWQSKHLVLTFAISSVITAGLLSWIARNRIPAIGVAVGAVILCATASFENASSCVGMVAWHFATAMGFRLGLRKHKQLVFYDRSKCRSCHYDLTGLTSGVCPECGLPTPTDFPSHDWNGWH